MAAIQNSPVLSEAQDDDDDDISLTSTVHEGDDVEDADKDWVVEDLLAERPHPYEPGQTQYLIRWEGFALEDCTWEPEENLGPGLLPQWEETKREIEAKKRQPFDLEEYNAACIAKAERHMRRNNKRKRLGFQLTEPFPEEPSPETPTTPTVVEHSNMDSSDEAEEVNEIDADTSTFKEPHRQKVTKQKSPEIIPSMKVRTEPSTTQASKARRPSHSSPSKPSSEALQPVNLSAKASGPSARPPGGTMTGYQGTARKPSINTNQNTARSAVRKAPGQKKTAPISKPPSSTTTAPIRSSSFANKFAGKRLTATRTRPQPAAQVAASKVFIPSKPRRQRRSLADAMVDPTKAPKQFSTMRIRNMANKRALEKNDATANYSSIPASFFLSSGGATPKSKENSLPSNTSTCDASANQMKSQGPPTTTEACSLTHSPVAISPVDTGNPEAEPEPAAAPKVKKSVRFAEVVGDNLDSGSANLIFAEPMDIDHPPTDPIASSVSPSGPRKLSLATYQERPHTQVVSRTVMLGPDGSQELRVLFNGVARHGDTWLSAFMAHDKMHFNTTCASYNFLSQTGYLVSERLSRGVIEPNFQEQAQTLGNVAEWLRRSSLGMHLVTPEYSILLYPAGCDAWREIDTDVGSFKPDAPLRHLIYRSTCDPKLYPLLPAPSPSMNLDELEHRSQTLLLTKELTGLDFDTWLPQEPNQKDNQAYMLLFPPEEEQASKMIKHWLQSARPGCRIFSNENPRSWLKFHECVKAGVGGTIIIHSNITLCLWKIRDVWKMLRGNDYTFWDLSTGEFEQPLYPSDPWATIEPGTLQMTRLFPFGRAVLITPSFVLSEPEMLCRFLRWFRSYAANPNYLIMACADFPKYLKDVTLEKEREYKEFCDAKDCNVDKMLEEFGRRKEDIEATFRAWEILQDIIKVHGDENTGEDVRKVYWITDMIDPNDEQSLVNYFVWWSTTRLDRYRRFFVLGSRASMAKRAYRNILVPTYTDISVSNPDVAAARQDQRAAEQAAKETKNGDVFSEMPANSDAQSDTGVKRTSISQPYFKFPSKLFETDRAQELRTWITSNDGLRMASWSRLHTNPVSWVDVPMADQFNDALCTYDTYRNWFYGAPVFNRHTNTWYGLFYTIDKVWDPRAPLSTYGRHPWIAIYRPVNPHLIIKGHSCNKMELFIWDIAASHNEPTRGPWGCLDMQCRLIDMVREETPQRDANQVLERVWVSSATSLEVDVGDHLLDVTCEKILEMYYDARRWLPPFDKLLENVGWKEVPRSSWENGMALGAGSRKYSQRETLPIPRNASDEGKLEHSIWHPPPGKIKDGSHTVCLNDLYEAALKARLENPSCRTMRYQYRDTMEWYADQVKEQRAAGHVCVDSGKRLVNRIANAKK